MQNETAILFVDDEPNVLSSLRRGLRIKHDEWHMVFVSSGKKALAAFEKYPFDVVVSDIRMPEMDGSALLGHIQREYPNTIRIALSGQIDLNGVIRSIQAVHQYVSKPCDIHILIEKINGCLKSRELLNDAGMLGLISKIDTLPILPEIYSAIEEELNSSSPSIRKVADSIVQDVGFVTKIIKVINSPFFGLTNQIDSIHDAITILGLDTIKALLFSTHLFTTYENFQEKEALSELWAHCFRVSNIAQLLARYEHMDKKIASQCRMAGLLHDVGKILMETHFPDQYSLARLKVQESGLSLFEAENEIFSTNHAKVGAYLMGLWGIPGDVTHAIGYHHKWLHSDMSVTMFTCIANCMDHHLATIHQEGSRERLHRMLAPLVFDNEQLDRWLKYVVTNWDLNDAFSRPCVEIMEDCFHRRGK